MKTGKMLSLLIILAIGISIVGIAQAEARRSRKKTYGRWKNMPISQTIGMIGMLKTFAKELNLTTEQEQEIAEIVAKYRVTQNKWRSLRQARSELMKKMLTEEFDEAAIRAEYKKLAAEREKLREERFVEQAKMLSEIKTVLTEDQRKILQENSADWFQKKQSPHKRRRWQGGYRKKW